MGLGGSLCSSTAQTWLFLDIPAERMGHASALWNMNRQVSFCVGAAKIKVILSALDSIAITFTMAAAPTVAAFRSTAWISRVCTRFTLQRAQA